MIYDVEVRAQNIIVAHQVRRGYLHKLNFEDRIIFQIVSFFRDYEGL